MFPQPMLPGNYILQVSAVWSVAGSSLLQWTMFFPHLSFIYLYKYNSLQKNSEIDRLVPYSKLLRTLEATSSPRKPFGYFLDSHHWGGWFNPCRLHVSCFISLSAASMISEVSLGIPGPPHIEIPLPVSWQKFALRGLYKQTRFFWEMEAFWIESIGKVFSKSELRV